MSPCAATVVTSPEGPVLRNPAYGSAAARGLYPEVRQTHPASLPKSPVIGTGAPVQYEQREDIGAPRKRLPGRTVLAEPHPEGARGSGSGASGSGGEPEQGNGSPDETIRWTRGGERE